MNKEGNLRKMWCEMNGIEYNGDTSPIMLRELSAEEKEKVIAEFNSQFKSHDGKRIMLWQASGGDNC